MKKVASIYFERIDREILAEAALAAPIAFPDDGGFAAEDARRLLNGLAASKNDPITYARLSKAQPVLEHLRSVLSEQAEVEWWLSQLTADAAEHDKTLPEPMRAEHMANVLADTRLRQMNHVERALRLVRVAKAEIAGEQPVLENIADGA